MSESGQEGLRVFGKVGAVITDSHIVYTSGKHGTAYVDKDRLYPHTRETSYLCRLIADQWGLTWNDIPDIVVSPEKGGIILSQWVAHHLSRLADREVLAFYAEKTSDGGFIIHRGGATGAIPGKRVLVVEDVLTTGGSAKKVVEATRAMGGNVIGLGVLCNRGGITAADVGNPPRFWALVNVKMDAWDEAECPLCGLGIPINTDIGKGREYLARKKGN